ncbi:MAG: tetratricopeptide repeat protein, partial [Acidobacteriota bacterium]
VCEVAPLRMKRRLSPKQAPGLSEVQRQQMLRVRGWKTMRSMEWALDGDLEWIVRKAMAKDPQRRYASVEQLGTDLQRHLGGLPVLAAPDNLGYRLKKSLLRHRLAAAAAAALMVAVIGFGLSMAVLARSVTQERDRMARERERADQVSQFLGRMFQVSYPNEARGNTAMARDLLRQAAREAGPRFAQQPRVLATVWWTLGEAFRNLAIPAEAIPLLERSLILQNENYGPSSLEAAEVLVSLGQARASQFEWSEAERRLRHAVAIRAAESGADSDATIEARRALAGVLRATNQEREAERLLRQALAPLRVRGNDIDLAGVQAELSDLLASRGVLREAEDLARESLALRRKVYGEEHASVADSLEGLGRVLLLEDREFMAEPHLRQAIAMRQRLLGTDHELTARAMERLAVAVEATGNHEEAGQLLAASLASKRRLWSEGHRELLGILEQYAGHLMRHGKAADAAPLLDEALMIAARHFPNDTALHDRLAKHRAAIPAPVGAKR